ncbi:MAG: helix-turn-helix domain-containing protein [Candidatus Omnitrophica bacterium]|nr:helix-turn-helix domain-containing protein [Candidatus Omnitrophota bacterium]MBU1783835.1 helix-turn-helix domain-containing protein [Candidatus Omnitrophota bacterium]MBU1851836.1 helix-turn-helix domain-containing protein [Candidatus Omnitrophota bacterium]
MKKYLTIPELAKLMGLSRAAVYKRVRQGKIKAIRVGRNYAVPQEIIGEIMGEELTDETKRRASKAIKKTLKEYGETLKLLGND